MSRLSDLYKAMETLRKEGLSKWGFGEAGKWTGRRYYKKGNSASSNSNNRTCFETGTKGTRIGGRL